MEYSFLAYLSKILGLTYFGIIFACIVAYVIFRGKKLEKHSLIVFDDNKSKLTKKKK